MDKIVSIPRMSNILGIYSCHTTTVQSGWSYHDHHHSFFEFLFCIGGDVTEWVQDQDIRFRSGDCILIKPGVRHSTLNASTHSFSYISLTLDLEDMELRKKLLSVDLVHLSEGPMNTDSVTDLFRQIYELMNSDTVKNETFILSTHQRLIFESIVLLILKEWIQLSEMSRNETGVDLGDIRPSVMDLAHKTAKFLENAVYKNVQIQELALSWHISRSLLTKSFSQVYGKSPREYLTQLKLQKAKELLIHTNLTVESVAEQLAFSSIYHFSRQFRRWSGVSPIQFRSKLR